jgi:hypothetical protein
MKMVYVQDEILRNYMLKHKEARVRSDQIAMERIETELKLVGRHWEATVMRDNEYDKLGNARRSKPDWRRRARKNG